MCVVGFAKGKVGRFLRDHASQQGTRSIPIFFEGFDEALHRGAEVEQFLGISVVRFELAVEVHVKHTRKDFHRGGRLRHGSNALGSAVC